MAAGVLEAPVDDPPARTRGEATGERDDAVAVALEQLHVDARLAAVQALEEAGAGELREVLEALVVLREQREVVALDLALADRAVVDEVGLEAQDRLDVVLPAGLEELDRAVHHAVVGEAQRGLPELGRAGGELVDLAGAVQQRVLRVDVQMCDGGRAHGIGKARCRIGRFRRRAPGLPAPCGKRHGRPASAFCTWAVIRAGNTRAGAGRPFAPAAVSGPGRGPSSPSAWPPRRGRRGSPASRPRRPARRAARRSNAARVIDTVASGGRSGARRATSTGAPSATVTNHRAGEWVDDLLGDREGVPLRPRRLDRVGEQAEDEVGLERRAGPGRAGEAERAPRQELAQRLRAAAATVDAHRAAPAADPLRHAREQLARA